MLLYFNMFSPFIKYPWNIDNVTRGVDMWRANLNLIKRKHWFHDLKFSVNCEEKIRTWVGSSGKQTWGDTCSTALKCTSKSRCNLGQHIQIEVFVSTYAASLVICHHLFHHLSIPEYLTLIQYQPEKGAM